MPVNVYEIMIAARDAMTVRRVYGEPCERDGVTLVPAALVAGGLGAGSGRRTDRRSGAGGAGRSGGDDRRGDGGGFGMAAIPVGAYSIRDGRVRWHPAVNVDVLVIAAAAVTVTWLSTRARTGRRRR